MTPALLGLFSLVTLWAADPTILASLHPRSAAWYHKPEPSFSDAIAAVRRLLWSAPSLSMSRLDPDRVEIPTELWQDLPKRSATPLKMGKVELRVSEPFAAAARQARSFWRQRPCRKARNIRGRQNQAACSWRGNSNLRERRTHRSRDQVAFRHRETNKRRGSFYRGRPHRMGRATRSVELVRARQTGI